jgi:hypothetical protein
MRDRGDVEAVKAALRDPADLCRRLGLLEGAKRQGGGLLVRCPAHGDRNPSCSITRGPDGTLRVRCFGCDFSGDALSLVAAVEGLNVARDFRRVLETAASIAGVTIEAQAAPANTSPPRAPREAPPPPPPRTPPPVDEVLALWNACAPCAKEPDVAAWLSSRGIDVDAVDRYGLARALPAGLALPSWASYRGEAATSRPWTALGYRAIFPLYDESGQLASVRARLVLAADHDGPKSLPPVGYSTRGLVLACPLAVFVLQIAAWRASGDHASAEHTGDGFPWYADRRVVLSEGEPDFLTWAARGEGARPFAVLGLPGSGAWSDELAERIPTGCTVIVRTDDDDAGDRYAEQIAASLRGRCEVRETDPDARAARRRARVERDAERRLRGAEQVTIPGSRSRA